MKLALDCLEIIDDNIIVKSHETYIGRKALFEHMNEEIERRTPKNVRKQSTQRLKEIKDEVKEEAVNYFVEQISE